MKSICFSILFLISIHSFCQDTIVTRSGKIYTGEITADNGNDLFITKKDYADIIGKEKIKYSVKSGVRQYYKEINCQGVEKEVDKYTGKITFRSDIREKFIMFKAMLDADTVTFIYMRIDASNPNFLATGAYILFENGDKIIRPNEKVDCKYLKNARTLDSYEMTATLTLTKEDIRKLSTSNIKEYKVYIYESELAKDIAQKMRQQFICIADK